MLTLVASYPVAYALARTPSRRVRSWLLVLTLAPFFTGAIVRTYAWMLVLGNTVVTWPVPMLFTERGVLVGLVHFSMPTMILLLAAAISHIDPVYERAAASLGARPARVFLARDAAAVPARHVSRQAGRLRVDASARSPRRSCSAAAR